MAGRSAVAEVMDGAGPVSERRGRAEGARGRDGRPGPRRRDGQLVERFGEVQARFEELGGYALEGRAREILAGLGFSPGDDGRRRRRAVGRLEDARRARAHPADAPRRDAARRADQPPRPREPDLARALPQGLRGRAADDLARPRVHEPHRHQDRRDRRRRAHHLLRQLRLLRAAARARREAAAGAVRAPAGDARQGDQVHRALQGARLPRRAGAVPREEAREDRAGRAAEAPPDGGVRLPAGAALRRGRGQPEERAQGLRQPQHLRRARLPRAPPRALVRDGRQRRRQVDAAQAGRRRDRSRTPARWRSAAA